MQRKGFRRRLLNVQIFGVYTKRKQNKEGQGQTTVKISISFAPRSDKTKPGFGICTVWLTNSAGLRVWQLSSFSAEGWLEMTYSCSLVRKQVEQLSVEKLIKFWKSQRQVAWRLTANGVCKNIQFWIHTATLERYTSFQNTGNQCFWRSVSEGVGGGGEQPISFHTLFLTWLSFFATKYSRKLQKCKNQPHNTITRFSIVSQSAPPQSQIYITFFLCFSGTNTSPTSLFLTACHMQFHVQQSFLQLTPSDCIVHGVAKKLTV